jgi:hypothetical protein
VELLARSDGRYGAMRDAVHLARTGAFSNWWTIAARLRIKRYPESDLAWTETQRQWLDGLCTEARRLGNTGQPRGVAGRLIDFRQMRG